MLTNRFATRWPRWGMMAAGWLCGVRLMADLLPVPPANLEPDLQQAAFLQRTVSLLKSATPGHKPTLRILYYGNSHATMDWWRLITERLVAANPNVNFVVTNKALVAFESARLIRTAVADIGGWQPDLVFVTTYGSFGDPDLGERNDFIPFFRRLRELSTADVIVFPPHVISPLELAEPSSDEEDTDSDPYYALFYKSMPAWANAEGYCWVNTRTAWKKYLLDNQLPPSALLGPDEYHTNADGWVLLREIFAPYLQVRNFQPPMDPWNNSRIQSREVGTDLAWSANALDLKLTGGRVDVVYESNPPADSPTFSLTLDGQDPKEIPALYGFNRTSSAYGLKYPWPGIMQVLSSAPLLEETWTLHIDSIDFASSEIRYSVSGSKTGPDGSGSSLRPFDSDSGRVRIIPNDLMLWIAYSQTRQTPPEGFEVTWDAVRRSVSTFKPVPAAAPGLESVQTLFVGAPDTEHTLRITSLGGTPKGIKAIRVYSPSGNAALVGTGVPPVLPPTLSFARGDGTVLISWPKSSAAGSLEVAAALGASPEWKSVPQPAVDVGGRWQIAVPATGGVALYRWRSNAP